MQCEPPLHYRGGQFMTLFNGNNMGNRFPISSPTSGRLAGKVDIQVQRIPGGVFSEWIHTSLRAGDVLSACGATGELFFEFGDPGFRGNRHSALPRPLRFCAGMIF